MQLGLMRVSNGSQQPIGLRDLQETLIQADRLRLRQIHLSDLGPEVLATLPKLDQLRIGLDLTAFHPQAPSALVGAIRIAQDQTDGRLVLGLPMGGAGDRCTASQTYETLLSDTEARPLASDLPISPRSLRNAGCPQGSRARLSCFVTQLAAGQRHRAPLASNRGRRDPCGAQGLSVAMACGAVYFRER